MATLVDQYGRPIDKGLLRREIAAPELAGVRQVISGLTANGMTPQRLARLLRTAEEGDAIEYLELAEAIEERDLHYLGVLSQRKRAVTQLEITVEAATDSAADVANADLVRDWIAREGLEDEVFDILDAISKGYSATEIIWETSERQWWPKRLEWRDPRWFEFDRVDGRTPLIRETGPSQPLPPGKFVFHTHKAKSGLPIRGGLARPVAWAWMFKTFSLKDWVVFAEVYGMPLRLGKYGPGASEKDIATLLRAVSSIGHDAAAVVPQSMEIEFQAAASGAGADVFKVLCDYLDQQVSKAVLGQTTTTDAISGGHAVSKEHQEVRMDILASDGKQVAASLNRDLVVPLISLNRGPQKRYPRICIKLVEEEDTKALVDNVERLVPLGLTVETSVMRDKLGLPDPPAGAEVLRARAPAAAGPQPPAEGAPGQTPARPLLQAQGAGDASDAIDNLVSEILEGEGWEPLMAPIVAGLEERLAAATTLEEARRILAEQLGRMDVTQLADMLARGMLVSRLAGEGDIPLSDSAERGR